MRRSLFLALALTTGLAAQACAAPMVAVQDEPMRVAAPPQDVPSRLLAAHNAERRRVGTPPLQWDDTLAAEARVWARVLVDTGRWEHDPTLHGNGENLWTGWGSRIWTPEEMVAEWAAEKRDYVHGVFPHVSRTGDWTAVGHYTQIIARRTTHVGCAIASRGDRSVLACRYSPPGNVDGLRAY
ncbi:CAP domain-containing protein [Brevundimonas sp. UBA2416]|uniref:CAP domain-containing protein n=1 Tax=Brevundimonas sp. UBA2416 TaxID=1946124 RepID=UPI0025C460DD|nr:CAP domain-containing protein [Brevundimonas sp. UBA2416]